MERREFITLLGGAAALWPLAAHPQQSSAPTVGFLISASAIGYERVIGPVLEGLAEAGYVDGKNLTIEYRWADYHYDRLPILAAELVDRKVAVVFTTGSIVSALAAKSATSHYSDRLRKRQRSGEIWTRGQPQPTKRQCHRRDLL